MRSAYIFDQLTNDFKIRKEAILIKLEEMGLKCTLTELLSLNLFHGQSIWADALTKQQGLHRNGFNAPMR